MRDNQVKPFEFGSGLPPTVHSTRAKSRRWVWICALLVFGIGAGAGYLYYFERDFAEQWLSKTPLKTTLKPSVTQVYKWRDAQGNWQITDRPPPDVEYEMKEYRSDENIVPSIKLDEQ